MRKILLALPIIFLQGCVFDETRDPKVHWNPHVERKTQSYTLTFSKGGSTLSQSQKHQIRDAISQIPLKDLVCRVYVFDVNTDNLSALTQRRLKSLKENMELYGLKSHKIHILGFHNDLQEERNPDPHSIIVKFDHYTRLPNHCPSWNEKMDVYIPTSGEKNFGCSNAHNTALMVDDPSTLLKGKTLKEKEAITAVRAVKNYQDDKVKTLKVAKSATQGTASS